MSIEEEIAAIYAHEEHFKRTFDEQVGRCVNEVLECGLDLAPKGPIFGGRMTARERLVRRIQDKANMIRSWHAFGEPSDYGKAICALLAVEKRMVVQVLIRAGRVTRNGEVTQPKT